MAYTATTSDAQIQEDVLRELRRGGRIEATDIGVEVDRGVVTLTGVVDGYGKAGAATEAAHRAAGVLDVANDIVVRFPGSFPRTDAEIAHEVRNALKLHPLLPQERIHTTVTAGWVTLDGFVDSWRDRERLESLVLQLPGVRGVTSRVIVNGLRGSASRPDVFEVLVDSAGALQAPTRAA